MRGAFQCRGNPAENNHTSDRLVGRFHRERTRLKSKMPMSKSVVVADAFLGVDRSLVSLDVKNSDLQDFHNLVGPNWNETGLAQESKRLDVPLVDAWAAALDGMDDTGGPRTNEVGSALPTCGVAP